MSDVNHLTDIKLDLKTGFVVIDSITNDAVLLRGSDVIIQDVAIKLRTQIGTVKRQELDSFGWNFLGRLKQKLSPSQIESAVSAVSKAILEDERIDDAEVAVTQNPVDDNLIIEADIRIGEVSLPLTLTI